MPHEFVLRGLFCSIVYPNKNLVELQVTHLSTDAGAKIRFQKS